MEKNDDSPADPQPSNEQIQTTLATVVSSKVFSTSPRLQEFLRYVVEQTLAGRGGHIKGKTIAVDVYDRQLDDDGAAQNLVRVEARRLRRLLAEYYETEGSSDPVQIQITPGGYRPNFVTGGRDNTTRVKVAEQPAGWLRLISLRLLIVGIGVALISIGTIVLLQPGEPTTADRQPEMAIREAIRERSVPALQAINLAQQARGLIFPIFDAKRQNLALEMFRHVMQLDPSLPHGYCGAAQILATLSFITPNEEQATIYSNEARSFVDQALDLDPSNAWAHGALAWTLATSGEFENALKHAQLAFEIAPQDGYVLDLVGKAAIVAQKPDLAALASDPDRQRSGAGRFGARNIWGLSHYMLGNYSATIEALSGAPAEGAPVSPPSLILLAVAHDHLGHTKKARELVEELSATWPNLPTALLVRRIFHDGTEIERDILQRLTKYGYDSRLE